MRMVLIEYFKAEFADRPDLLEKVVPDYPPGAKRMLRDNGVWAGTLKRDNVTSSPTRSAHHPDRHRDRRRRGARGRRDHLRHRLPGVEVPHADEGHRPRRRRPARAVGRRRTRVPRRHGPGLPEPVLPLRPEHQHRDQRQHHLLLRVRRAVHPRLRRSCCWRRRRRRSRCAPTCTTSSTSASTPRTGDGVGLGSVNSWYKNDHGHVAQNWPFTLLEYWQRTKETEPSDFQLTFPER